MGGRLVSITETEVTARETWNLTVTSGGEWVATVRIEGCTEEEADIACLALLRLYSQRRGLAVQVEPKR